MILFDKNSFSLRLADALTRAHADGAELFSVAFPPLPEYAFERIANVPEPALLFFFENEKKGIAEIGLDFRTPIVPAGTFENLAAAIPENRAQFSLVENENSPCVPAPKIFIAGTFDEASARPFAAIPTWQISKRNDTTQICAHFRPTKEIQTQAGALLADYERILSLASAEPNTFPPLPPVASEAEVGGSDYRSRAAHAISEINAGKFEKIVLARARDFHFSPAQNFPAGTLLAALRNRFLSSGCTIFAAPTSAAHTQEKIIGATPEMLIRLQNGKLETEALAGTVANVPGETQTRAEALFSDVKERWEHRLVVDFIAEKLRRLRLSPRFPTVPGILALPNVLHLHTPIEADVPDRSVSLGKIVAALHPTPAMCGVPAAEAKKFIIENEAFPRENFSAPVGFLDADGNGFFAVAIRCAKIFNDKIRLYAGSGLVSGSVPEKEFSEINAKISALASLLRK